MIAVQKSFARHFVRGCLAWQQSFLRMARRSQPNSGSVLGSPNRGLRGRHGVPRVAGNVVRPASLPPVRMLLTPAGFGQCAGRRASLYRGAVACAFSRGTPSKTRCTTRTRTAKSATRSNPRIEGREQGASRSVRNVDARTVVWIRLRMGNYDFSGHVDEFAR